MSGPTAAWATALFELLLTGLAGQVTLRHPDEVEDDRLGPAGRTIAAVLATEHPHIHGLRDELIADQADRAACFAWSVRVLLSGIEATPRP